MAISTDLTLITDINSFKLGQGITFVCDVSSLISNYEEYKLYSVSNNELTELVDVSEKITAGLIVYKYYPQTSGSLNIVLGTEEVSGTIHRSNTVQLTINNNSHAENIFNANAALVANLTSMGVLGASTNDGLATNIAKVTSIPPTQRGIELDTSITCFAPATASVGVPFNITGVLTSSYDDTSQANVDMHGGEIQGATIEIYNGNTLLGTCTTNIDGEYTFTYTPTVTGTLSIKAVYDSANDFYEDSASNSNSVSVHVAVSSVSLVTDKSILSYVNNESATLTATVLDNNNEPVVGETVSFDIVDPDTGEVISNIDTATTNSNGECSVSYYSNDVGDLYIQGSCNGILSLQTYVKDFHIYDDCSSDKTSRYDKANNLSLSYNGTDYTAYASEANRLLNVVNDIIGDFEFAVTMKQANNYGGVCISDGLGFNILQYNYSGGYQLLDFVNGYSNNYVTSSGRFTNNSNYFKWIITREGTTLHFKVQSEDGNTTLKDVTHSDSHEYNFLNVFFLQGTVYIKEISVKHL